RGDYVARLDADDVAAATRLERQVTLLDAEPDVLLAGSAARVIDEAGRVIGRIDPPGAPGELYDALAFSNPIVHSAAMFRRAPVLALGGYPESYLYAQDLALWLQLAQRGRLAMIGE